MNIVIKNTTFYIICTEFDIFPIFPFDSRPKRINSETPSSTDIFFAS